MDCLVVKAHPLDASLCSTLTRRAIAALEAGGHRVSVEDLYAEGFGAALTPEERRSYYAGDYSTDFAGKQVKRLLAAEAIVLVFPTWWFGFPAILKGWFDRVWAPGVAYDHANGFGPIKPRLHRLRRMLAVTSLGSPWWVDRLVLRQPARKVLKTALVGTCAPRCRFDMISLYRSENLRADQVEAFVARMERHLGRWPATCRVALS